VTHRSYRLDQQLVDASSMNS